MNKVDAWQKDIFAKCKLMRPLYTPIIGVDELDGKKLGSSTVSDREKWEIIVLKQ